MFLKIKNPKKPGEFLVLHKDDFREGEHELFEEGEPEPVVELEKPAAVVHTAPKAKARR